MTLVGRRVLVTGASGGIGAAIGRGVVGAGGTVALLARRADRLSALATELGEGATAIACDVTDDEALRNGVAAAAEALGGLDAIVANAGAAHMGHIATGNPDVWREFIELDLLACLSTVRYGLDYVTATPGDVILVGSTAARRPMEATGVYSAAKAAVAAAAESLRLELGGRGIRVCLLEPGRVDTEIGVNARLEEGGRHGSMGEAFVPVSAEEVADVVVYVLTRPANLALNLVVLRPVAQAVP
jgi:NADP-dependent 3-hydroxy acid dehydrogenase YdfG